jgi:ribonuclease E
MASDNEPTASLETEALEVPAATAPKRRRATKKAAAPAPQEGYAADAPTADASPAAGQTPEQEAPKAKRASRRTSKKAAPAESPEQATAEGGAPEGTESAEPVESTDAPESTPPVKAAKKTARKTTSRRATAKAAAPEPEPKSQEQPPTEAPVTAQTDEIREPAEADAEPEETDGADTDAEETEDGAAAAAPATGFGLLFQAPDTTVVRRSRRATAPVQAPVVVDEPAVEAPADDASTEAPTDDATEGEASGNDSAGDGQSEGTSRSRRRRGGRGRRSRGPAEDTEDSTSSDRDASASESSDDASGDESAEAEGTEQGADSDDSTESSSSSRRRRRRRRGSAGGDSEDPPGTVTRVREPRPTRNEPTAVRGSTRLEAKKQRRREGREAGRRRTIITEAEFLARRESVERVMVVRGTDERTQIGVLEDGVLVEHYVSRETSTTMVGNVYLGRVQNVLPSMEAAFVDIGKGRNAVLYAGEVNWDAAGLEVNQAKRIENALTSGDTVLVQVTKDPIGHKGARLTSQISLPGRFLVYVPEGSMTGISRKLPDTERARLKSILKEIVPDSAGVIVRTAAEGASEEELRADVERLTKAWDSIQSKAASAASKKAGSGGAPSLVHGEPDLTVRVIRDIFTEDFTQLVVSGDRAWSEVSDYVEGVAPDLAERLTRWTSEEDLFTHHRVQEQIAKAMDRKVWLPSGGSLVIDRTEAMTVVDVNTGKFVGSGGNLEETVTKNNIEAAEEIVRQLRLRDIGGIIVIDFIDMVLESNRDLVVRRLLECLGRDRTKHQVAEVTSLGLVQMTRKRVGSGLIEVFSENCEHCNGRGIIVHAEPIDKPSGNGGSGGQGQSAPGAGSGSRSRGRRGGSSTQEQAPEPERKQPAGPTAAQIAAAAHAAALKGNGVTTEPASAGEQDAPVEIVREVDGDETTPGSALERRAGSDLVTTAAPTDQSSSAEPASSTDQSSSAEAASSERHASASNESSESSASSDQGDAVDAAAASETPAPTTGRGRRRRGRVVAPAGPPRAAAEGDSGTDA